MIGLIIVLAFIPDDKYIHNMQSYKGKANIFYKDEPDNPYDPEAIQIFTLNKKKEEIFLGYIEKNEVLETIYTEEADELYVMAQCGVISREEAKADKNWRKVEEVIKELIYNKSELDHIKKDIDKGFYKFMYKKYDKYGFLFKPAELEDLNRKLIYAKKVLPVL